MSEIVTAVRLTAATAHLATDADMAFALAGEPRWVVLTSGTFAGLITTLGTCGGSVLFADGTTIRLSQ